MSSIAFVYQKGMRKISNFPLLIEKDVFIISESFIKI